MTGGSIIGNISEGGNGDGIFGYYSSSDAVIRISNGVIAENQSGQGGNAIAIDGEGNHYARLELSGAPIFQVTCYSAGIKKARLAAMLFT